MLGKRVSGNQRTSTKSCRKSMPVPPPNRFHPSYAYGDIHHNIYRDKLTTHCDDRRAMIKFFQSLEEIPKTAKPNTALAYRRADKNTQAYFTQHYWHARERAMANTSCACRSLQAGILCRVGRFSTTKYGRFLSVDPSKFSPPNVSIYNSVHVAIRTQIPHKQWTLLIF